METQVLLELKSESVFKDVWVGLELKSGVGWNWKSGFGCN